eukprot:scaffold78457_cov19-Tisochrysis_lutea.AAC.1
MQPFGVLTGTVYNHECTVRNDSSLIGVSIRAAGFYKRFGAAVAGVRRNKKHVEGKLGDIMLQPGDELVLDTGEKILELS